jgi:hypothetical protein
MRKPIKLTAAYIIAAIVFLCIGAFIIETQTKIFHRTYDDLILDNKNHYLPCDQLPDKNEVSRIIQEQQDTVLMIENVNSGFVGVEIDATLCPGKADLLIWYASHQDRVAIEKIIGGNSFFGVPYRLQNR